VSSQLSNATFFAGTVFVRRIPRSACSSLTSMKVFFTLLPTAILCDRRKGDEERKQQV
jgi:hypothetical protein